MAACVFEISSDKDPIPPNTEFTVSMNPPRLPGSTCSATVAINKEPVYPTPSGATSSTKEVDGVWFLGMNAAGGAQFRSPTERPMTATITITLTCEQPACEGHTEPLVVRHGEVEKKKHFVEKIFLTIVGFPGIFIIGGLF